MKKIIYLISLVCVFSAFVIKKDSKYESGWANVIIDSSINKNSVFDSMNNEKEVAPSGWNSNLKRTCDVVFNESNISEHLSREDSIQNLIFFRNYSCRLFKNKDTLNIYIEHMMTASSGLIIKYINQHFQVEKFLFSDFGGGTLYESPRKIVYQKLILNKSKYEVGDSLFGYIDYKAEDSAFKKVIVIKAQGYFRAVLEKN